LPTYYDQWIVPLTPETAPRGIANLPHALRDSQQFVQRLDGRRPVVFLDYDGTLTPIVDRPEDAVISEDMRDAVRRLAGRTTVCVISGRDRRVVSQWLGIESLVVAGSHGFDLGECHESVATGFEELLLTVTERLHGAVNELPGAVIEPKRFSVAVHYRLVAPQQRPLVTAVVDTLLADYPEQLKLTRGKMVYEIQPNLDWDKGKALQYLRRTLRVDGAEFVPLYLGDDITDEDAFKALKGPANGKGIGVIVADTTDPEQAGRATAAEFVLESIGEVQRFLDTLA
jgi:trehalose 6-phosphate phosphatase